MPALHRGESGVCGFMSEPSSPQLPQSGNHHLSQTDNTPLMSTDVTEDISGLRIGDRYNNTIYCMYNDLSLSLIIHTLLLHGKQNAMVEEVFR